MRLNWTETQIELLSKLKFSFDVTGILTDDQILNIDTKVVDYFQRKCIVNSEVVEEGFLCESILDVIGKL